mmetsp:Transcript_135063/g.419703  ORF Transcript_135063/g.419703 Transcript_135063/m.419703 type:complete len:260 (+) Transcript_135063:68-847(+)
MTASVAALPVLAAFLVTHMVVPGAILQWALVRDAPHAHQEGPAGIDLKSGVLTERGGKDADIAVLRHHSEVVKPPRRHAALERRESMVAYYEALAPKLVGAFSWPHTFMSSHWTRFQRGGGTGYADETWCVCLGNATEDGVFLQMAAFGERQPGVLAFTCTGGQGVVWKYDGKLRLEAAATGRAHFDSEDLYDGQQVTFEYSGVGDEDSLYITDSWTAVNATRTAGRGTLVLEKDCTRVERCRGMCDHSDQWKACIATC